MKVVLAAAMWNCPHLLVLDEPTNYLDRDSLGALAEGIKSFDGGVIMISHNAGAPLSPRPPVWRQGRRIQGCKPCRTNGKVWLRCHAPTWLSVKRGLLRVLPLFKASS